MPNLLLRVVLIAAVALSAPSCLARRRAVAAPSPFIVIDVMELYTRDAPLDIEPRIRTAIADLNADMRNSGVLDVQFNLVYLGPIEKFDFAEPYIHALRDRYRADLVGVWASVMNERGGYSLVPDRANPLPHTGFHAIPNNQPAGTHLLSHEIGHNLGLMHEDGICRTDPPAFRDIMTQCDGIVVPVPLWRGFTNPEVLFEGVQTGPPDAASIIRAIAPKVAAYR